MATLSVTITESVTLSGKDQGDTTTKTLEDIVDVFKRTILVPTTPEIILYNTHASNVAGSTFDYDLLDYARITNTDSTNFISLRITDANNDEFVYKLTAGNSFILGTHVSAMTAEEAGGAGSPDAAISRIDAQADTAAIRCEVFVASR
jgi:hypothetical protein